MAITEAATQPTDAERFGHILQVQRAAYLRDGAPSSAKRRSDLKQFKAALLERRSAIEEAIDADFGNRSRRETAMMEVLGVVQGIDYLVRHLRRFMRPTRRHVALHMRSGSNHIEYQPLGVVGVISPWNYPVNLSLMPVVTAIAAGDRVMLKPSKFTPATNALLASMIGEIFPEEQVAIVSGDGAAFSSLAFDHLVFTGSSSVGRPLMKAASENLVPVTLELGGKSPTIVAKGHVRDRTVSDIVFGKLLSGGQTCIAPDYALVHESEIDAFIDSYDRLVKAAYPEGPTSKDYTSIVNDQQYSILTDLLDDARAHGHGSSRSDTGRAMPPVARTRSRRASCSASPTRCGSPTRRSSGRSCLSSPTATSMTPSTTSTPDRDRSPSTTSAPTTPTGARCSTARPPATSPSTARSCTSARTTCPSVASARAAWASTTASRASARSATPRASSCRAAGTASTSSVRPSASVRTPSSASSSDEPPPASVASHEMRGSCTCGANSFEMKAGVAMQRFYCHCLYCQQFMGKPYTDVTFVRAKNVVINGEHATFTNPKLLPPGFAHGRGSRFGNPDKGRFAKCARLDRGRCDNCGQPLIETIGGSAGMVFIPSANFEHQDALPPVQRHIYYGLREQDVADDLPKHHYFARSQLAIAAMIGRVLRRG